MMDGFAHYACRTLIAARIFLPRFSPWTVFAGRVSSPGAALCHPTPRQAEDDSKP
jgi:hypothetical protein